jgi:hypothetical protein
MGRRRAIASDSHWMRSASYPALNKRCQHWSDLRLVLLVVSDRPRAPWNRSSASRRYVCLILWLFTYLNYHMPFKDHIEYPKKTKNPCASHALNKLMDLCAF